MSTKVLLSIDVEDWFQVENLRPAFPPESWSKQEYRVLNNMDKILSLLSEKSVKCTFFCLGNIAERFPSLIKRISDEGHEIASHGYNHIMLTEMSNDEIYEDLKVSKHILEDLTGDAVIGYRAPAFSITDEAYNILFKLGYEYDSSLYQFSMHDRYGMVNLNNFEPVNSTVLKHASGITEFTMPIVNYFKQNIPWAGGGYFRIFPYPVYKKGVHKFLSEHQKFVFYMHPWEIDDTQPKIKSISKFNYFRHYYGLNSALSKLTKLIGDFNCDTIESSFKDLDICAESPKSREE